MKKIFSLLAAASLLLFVSCSKEEMDDVTPEVKLKGFQSGTHNGYYWQLWTEDGLYGSVDYSNGSEGNFSVSWNCNGNYTCGKGWSTGSTNRVIGYNCGSYSHNGGGGSFAVYGWTRNPLIEYYVQEKWPGSRPTSGINMGTVYSDGSSYSLRREQRYNAPSIDGTQTFWQLKSTRASQSATGSNNTVTFANHAQGWANGGMSLGSNHDYQILLQESWGQSNGYVNASVWDNGTSSGGNNDNGNNNPSGTTIVIRARGVAGGEHINLMVNNQTIRSFTLGTSMQNYTATTTATGGIYVEYDNDASGMDVQIDYIQVNGSTRQAEDQSYNTGAWGNGECGGGSYSEWLHCSGGIGFGDV